MELGMILGTFGLGTIDENLQRLLEGMSQFPESSLLGTVQSWAKLIGLGCALGVGSYECYMMILGRRGMDVMKILHIIIISLCISLSSWICEAAKQPGLSLGNAARDVALAENLEVDYWAAEVEDAQTQYLKVLDQIKLKADLQKEADNRTWYQIYFDFAIGGVVSGLGTENIEEMVDNTKNMFQKAAITVETKITQWINIIIKYICELLFQVSYYGFLLAQSIFMNILAVFCPIAFALSLAPPFRSAWSQWLSKYLSLSLWGFVIYMILYYVCFIMKYSLQLDYDAYFSWTLDSMINSETLDFNKVKTIGMQGIGTTIMYAVSLLVGVFLLKFVPEVSSWLIPGGVSSGFGGPQNSAMGVAQNAANKGRDLANTIGTTAGKNLGFIK